MTEEKIIKGNFIWEDKDKTKVRFIPDKNGKLNIINPKNMTLEERKDNTYFDQTGRQILIGDLLKVYHFRTRAKIHYMYHVVVMEETGSFPVMACKAHYADKPHYRMFVLADNPQRVYHNAKIIGEQDWETKRLKIKIGKL